MFRFKESITPTKPSTSSPINSLKSKAHDTNTPIHISKSTLRNISSNCVFTSQYLYPAKYFYSRLFYRAIVESKPPKPNNIYSNIFFSFPERISAYCTTWTLSLSFSSFSTYIHIYLKAAGKAFAEQPS